MEENEIHINSAQRKGIICPFKMMFWFRLWSCIISGVDPAD